MSKSTIAAATTASAVSALVGLASGIALTIAAAWWCSKGMRP